MKSGIKLTNLLQTFSSNSQTLFRDFVTSKLSRVGLSKSYHDFALSLLNNKVRKNLFANVKQPITSRNPAIDFSFEFSRRSSSGNGGCGTAESFIKPFYKIVTSIVNLQETSIMLTDIAIARFFRNESHKKTSFAINDSCHVRKIGRYVDFWHIILRSFVVFSSRFFHNISWLQNYDMMIDENRINVQAERLNVLDLKRYAIV